jgi:hypothetical protein
MPTTPNATELSTCPTPHSKVMITVLDADHLPARDIATNGK